MIKLDCVSNSVKDTIRCAVAVAEYFFIAMCDSISNSVRTIISNSVWVSVGQTTEDCVDHVVRETIWYSVNQGDKK